MSYHATCPKELIGITSPNLRLISAPQALPNADKSITRAKPKAEAPNTSKYNPTLELGMATAKQAQKHVLNPDFVNSAAF